MGQFWTFFAFPLNLMLAVLWTAGWVWIWKNRPSSPIVRFMLSPAATVSALVLLTGACLWIGLFGDRDFVQSIFFVVLLLYVQTVVFMVVLRGWRRSDGAVRWRFLVIHVGFLLALGAGFWGSPDSSEYRAILNRGDMTHEAYMLDGGRCALSYELALQDFKVDFENGKPTYYEARVSVDGGETVKITVNHPFEVKLGEHIYIASVSDNGCVFQIVREPWRYIALVGILMLITGAFMLFFKGPVKQ